MIASIFLLPNGTFFIELVTVVVILLLMTKYILPPLNKALESRQEKIRESLAAADAAKAEAAAAGDERAALLTAARDQAARWTRVRTRTWSVRPSPP
jgi:F-type H+-transporting ATPase subunit b